MNKNTTIIVIAVLLVLGIGFWIYNSSSPSSSEQNSTSDYSGTPAAQNTNPGTGQVNNQNPGQPANPGVTPNNPGGAGQTAPGPQLFSDSPMAQFAYLISTSPYDANTTKALSGFKVTKKTLADGSTEYTLNAQNPEYHTQTYVVKPGEKLYFIERNLGDDVGNEDKFLGDDTAVLVDANGYVLEK